MSKHSTDSLEEPQALFGFLTSHAEPPSHLATGGGNSYTAEPPKGRDHAKIREFGQVATPSVLADALALWISSSSPSDILDPALGLGNLLHACRPLVPTAKLEGIEIDPDIVMQARHTAPVGATLICGNYLRMRVRPRAAIIANPPYIKAARLDFGEADWAGFEDLLDCRLDRLTNAYALFLLKIWHDLAPLGRAAVLIPSEFLNANYGAEIKRKLLRHIRPVGTLVLDTSLNAFDTALTTSAILLLEKSPAHRARVPAYLIRDLATLQPAIAAIAADPATTDPAGLVPTELSSFIPEEKWLNRILGRHEEHVAFTHRVGDFFRCSRGIATGANEYFCLRPSDLTAHRLASRDFLPCVTKAPDVGGLVFNCDAHAALQAEDKRCWLLAPAEPDAEMLRYLALGQSTGIADKFLPSHRSVWYLPENRAAAHAWVAVFSRETLKCVFNETDTRHLTCFHGIYARSGIPADAALVVLFLNSSLGRIAIRQAQRFYGDGLNKLEPKDVEAIPCPSLATQSDAINRSVIAQLKRIETLPAARQPAALDALAEGTFGLTPQAVS
jgi:adenine-specific DNA-methyltransferase